MTDHIMDLIDAYAEARHRCGCAAYNAQTAEARRRVTDYIESIGAGGMQSLRAPGFVALGDVLRKLDDTMGPGNVGTTALSRHFSTGTSVDIASAAINSGASSGVQALSAAPSSPWSRALEIRMAQGWKLKGDRLPVLYTDTINGEGVGRDDLWLCTTKALAASPTPPALSAAPAQADSVLEDAARNLIEAIEFTPLGLRAIKAMNRLRAALAASPTPPAEQQTITPETGNSASAKGAAITSESGAVYAELPELTSTEINDACWAFVEAMPHNLPGPIWNGLKPAVYAAICKFLQAAPKAAPGEREQAAQRLRELAGIPQEDVADPLHPRYIEGYKAGHAAGRKRAAPQQEAPKAAPVSSDTLHLLRRLLSNQHTLTGPEFRAELEKIVGEAYQQEAQEPGEIDRLRAALVYTAFALHGMPQYMLADGIALIDGDTVQVSRDGWTVQASANPLRQSAQPAPTPLSAREIELLDGMIDAQLKHAQRCDSIPNRPMAEKQKGWDMERVTLLRKLKTAMGGQQP